VGFGRKVAMNKDGADSKKTIALKRKGRNLNKGDMVLR